MPLRQVYRLEPFDRLRPEERSQVLGVQGNVWTEYMPDMACVEFMILPRLAALAEVGWPVNGNAIAPDGSTTYRQRGPDSGPD